MLAVGFRQSDRSRSDPYIVDGQGLPDNPLSTEPISANPGADAHMALCFRARCGIFSKLCRLDLFLEHVRLPSARLR